MIQPIDRDARLQIFVDSLTDPALIIDNLGSILCKNAAACEVLSLLGCRRRVAIQRMNDIFPESGGAVLFPLSETEIQSIKFTSNDQDLLESITLTPFFDNVNHIGVLKTQIESSSKDSFLQLVLESIPARVFWKDLDSTFLGCNSKFVSDAGVSSTSDIIGKKDTELFPSEGHLYIQDDLEVMNSGTSKLNIEEPQTLADGEVTWISTNKVPIRDQSGKVVGLMGSYTDITARVRHQQLMEYQARCDHLTGLPNRLALQERLQHFEESTENLRGGLLYIDLDHFKTVNDTLGHDIGDQVLIEVAERIKTTVSDRGFIARLGGDEFSVLVQNDHNLSIQDIDNYLISIANEIRLNLLRIFEIELNSIRLGVSIGIANFGSGKNNISEQLIEADIAMYEAKCAGRNLVLQYNNEMRKKSQRLNSLKSCLSTACENNEFYFLIQPQFNQDSNWIGGELLTRWISPSLGQVSADEFIPVCEQTGIVHKLGHLVFEQAIKYVESCTARHPDANIMPLAINVSAKQFQKKSFIKEIEDLVKGWGTDPSLIELELTESLLLDNKDEALSKLEELKSMGFTLAIDDFGTGYSSLSYISNLPIDKLKIDQTFTQQITQCSKQLAIVETIIIMAKNLDMEVIAEGVETHEQLECLKNLGCNEFQGFYFAKPMLIEDYVTNVIDKSLVSSKRAA